MFPEVVSSRIESSALEERLINTWDCVGAAWPERPRRLPGTGWRTKIGPAGQYPTRRMSSTSNAASSARWWAKAFQDRSFFVFHSAS